MMLVTAVPLAQSLVVEAAVASLVAWADEEATDLPVEVVSLVALPCLLTAVDSLVAPLLSSSSPTFPSMSAGKTSRTFSGLQVT